MEAAWSRALVRGHEVQPFGEFPHGPNLVVPELDLEPEHVRIEADR